MPPYLVFAAIAAFFSLSYASCATPGFLQCSEGPADFCCGPDTNCVYLAGNTTVICCPSGSNCAQIVPISCDINGQDNILHPENALKTTALDGTLSSCGTDSRCCPFGYICNIAGNCVMDADQSHAPITQEVLAGDDSSIAPSAISDASTSASAIDSTRTSPPPTTSPKSAPDASNTPPAISSQSVSTDPKTIPSPSSSSVIGTNAPPSATSIPKSKSISIPPATLAAVIVSIFVIVALTFAFAFWWFWRNRRTDRTSVKHASRDMYGKAEMDASSLRNSKRKAQELQVKQLRAQELEAKVGKVQELEGDGSMLHELEANAVRQSRMLKRTWI